MLLLIWGIVLVFALVLYYRQKFSIFKNHGVKHIDAVPLFGNMMKFTFRMEHLVDILGKLYQTFPDERFVGQYQFTKPIIIVKDLELIKKITVKDFEYFLDHQVIADETVEPFFARNLFSLKGQEWKDMRSTLSPAFTSSKIKLMVPFIAEVGEQMIRVLKKRIQESKSGGIDVEVKDLTSRFSNDVIATCAFGLKVDSQDDVDNQFYKIGKTAAEFKFKQMLLFFVVSMFPTLSKILKIKIFSNETKNFYVDLVLGTMKDREARQIVRPDMIHLLMEAKKGRLTHDDKNNADTQQDTGFATVEESSVGKKTVDRVWSDNDLVAQAVLFFIAGFDTISTAMSLALYELALHPDVQDRLVQEIKETDAKNGGKLDFNSILNMKYMDMVTSEVLRLWPPNVGLDRLCVKDYNLGKPNPKSDKDYIVRKGTIFTIPIWCIHRDPKLFPNPEKFDPERFSEENRDKINPMAYLPFGSGPRNCIGSRFALCELKVLLYYVLLHMELSPSEKTCIPAQLSTESFTPRLKGGHWLKFKARS